MSIKTRFAILLGFLLGGFAVSIGAIRWMERGQLEEIHKQTEIERGMALDRWLQITSRKWDALVLEYAQSAELAHTVDDAGNGGRGLSENLASLDAQAAWVVRPDGTVLLGVAAGGDPAKPLPVPASDFTRAATGAPTARFFADDASGLLEIATAPIRRGMEPPRGWLLVARRWDELRLRMLGGLAEGSLTLLPVGSDKGGAPSGSVAVTRALTGLSGQSLRTLRAEFAISDLPESFAAVGSQVWIFISFGVLVVVALALGLQLWVLRPLGFVGASLGRGDPSPLSPLMGRNDELSRVARLVESAFAQRDTLQREIAERTRAELSLRQSEEALRNTLEERTRLGRNLHDGIIQSLYAAGMGLAGVRVLLRPEQEDAAARLEQARRVLNETVSDLRGFIAGLEPESVRIQSFTQATRALLDDMQSIRPVHATLEIDEALASKMTLEQRAQALQIAREAVSNALRHGEAGEVHISLQARGDLAIFSIGDNGRGFDPKSRGAGGGLGLDNLAARARDLGAEIAVQSQPGEGTKVILSFKPSASSA